WRVDEHRHCGCAPAGADGIGHAQGGGGRARGVPRRAHAAPPLCERLFTAGWSVLRMSEGAAQSPRRVRSFVRREGRLTPGQARALETLLPEFGIPDDAPLLDFAALFGRSAPTALEIGFGNGETLLQMAVQ